MNLKIKLDLKKDNKLSYCQKYPCAYQNFKKIISNLFMNASDSLLKEGCQVLVYYRDITLDFRHIRIIDFTLTRIEDYYPIKSNQLDLTYILKKEDIVDDMLKEWVETFKFEEGLETKRLKSEKLISETFAIIYNTGN